MLKLLYRFAAGCGDWLIVRLGDDMWKLEEFITTAPHLLR